MSQNTTATQPRTVQTADRGKLDIRALVLLAILLAAGFILNFTVGKAISGISGGMISPEFIISAFCLTILVVRPNIGQALVIFDHQQLVGMHRSHGCGRASPQVSTVEHAGTPPWRRLVPSVKFGKPALRFLSIVAGWRAVYRMHARGKPYQHQYRHAQERGRDKKLCVAKMVDIEAGETGDPFWQQHHH